MNFKRFHESKNLFDKDNETTYDCYITSNGQWAVGAGNKTVRISCASNTQYTLSTDSTYSAFRIMETNSDNIPSDGSPVSGTLIYYGSGNQYTFTTSNTAKYIIFQANSASLSQWLSELMFSTGSQPLPYEPYSSEVWHDIPHYIHNTSTDTLTTLPADIYANDTTATVGLKGNMYQASGVSPTNPIQPQECGERTGNLWDGTYKNNWGVNVAGKRVYISTDRYAIIIPVDSNTDYTISRSEVGASTYFIYGLSIGLPNDNTVFEYCDRFDSNALSQTVNSRECNYLTVFFGAALSPDIMVNTGSTPLPYEPYGYKIPISSANTTTPIYLGEVETTRKVKKLVLDGTESYSLQSINSYGIANFYIRIDTSNQNAICTHLSRQTTIISQTTDEGYLLTMPSQSGQLAAFYMRISSSTASTVAELKEWLAAQYAAGTPVTVWYVLAEPTTGIVNEPLRKIGTYADSVSGITIPTIAGANTFSVGTTVQPSEVTVNYKGWHSVANVHERESGAWT